jgi:hypothetical protein
MFMVRLTSERWMGYPVTAQAATIRQALAFAEEFAPPAVRCDRVGLGRPRRSVRSGPL